MATNTRWKLVVGQAVSWSSASRGAYRHKAGVIVARVPPTFSTVDVFGYIPKNRRHYKDLAVVPRYLVRVQKSDGTEHYYAPRKHILESQNFAPSDIDKYAQSRVKYTQQPKKVTSNGQEIVEIRPAR
jgi:hypothetical protein